MFVNQGLRKRMSSGVSNLKLGCEHTYDVRSIINPLCPFHSRTLKGHMSTIYAGCQQFGAIVLFQSLPGCGTVVTQRG